MTLSSTEAELVSCSEAAREVIYLRALLRELGVDMKQPTILYEDNMGVVQIAVNNSFSSRTKHIDVRHKFVCEQVALGTIVVRHIAGEEQPADLLTKPLARQRFERLRDLMGVK